MGKNTVTVKAENGGQVEIAGVPDWVIKYGAYQANGGTMTLIQWANINAPELYAKMQAEAKEAQARNRAYVMSYMSRKGANYGQLTRDEMLEVYKRADGMGPWDAFLDEYFQGGWDWSHLRDSTPAAFKVMAEYIRFKIAAK